MIKKINGEYGDAYGLSFSPNGKLVAFCAHDGVNLWNAETGEFLRKIEVNQAVQIP